MYNRNQRKYSIQDVLNSFSELVLPFLLISAQDMGARIFADMLLLTDLSPVVNGGVKIRTFIFSVNLKKQMIKLS